jgi:hypothetical protein
VGRVVKEIDAIRPVLGYRITVYGVIRGIAVNIYATQAVPRYVVFIYSQVMRANINANAVPILGVCYVVLKYVAECASLNVNA